MPSPRFLPGAVDTTPDALALGLGIEVGRLVSGLWLAESPTRAGFPSPAADHRVVRLDLNAELVQHEEATMLVRVKGDSMRDAGIFDGNLLVVDKSLSAQHGDIVVAVLDDEFTVKQLYPRKAADMGGLQPHSPLLFGMVSQRLEHQVALTSINNAFTWFTRARPWTSFRRTSAPMTSDARWRY